ncbi:hypothetical protein J6590_067399, partial [Homalodisca vitripennis]
EQVLRRTIYSLHTRRYVATLVRQLLLQEVSMRHFHLHKVKDRNWAMTYPTVNLTDWTTKGRSWTVDRHTDGTTL